MRCSSWNSCSSLTELAVGLTEVGCCAAAGSAMNANAASASIATATRRRPNIVVMPFSPPVFVRRMSRTDNRLAGSRTMLPEFLVRSDVGLRRDGFLVGSLPAPGARSVTALDHALLVDLRDDLAVAGEQRLCRAHLGSQRQLAVGEAVRAVLLVLGRAVVRLRTAG